MNYSEIEIDLDLCSFETIVEIFLNSKPKGQRQKRLQMTKRYFIPLTDFLIVIKKFTPEQIKKELIEYMMRAEK